MLKEIGTFYSNVNRQLNNTMSYTIGNKIVYGLVYLLILLYISQLSPELPNSVTKVFKNTYFRIFMYVIILWTVRIDVGLGLIMAIAFVMTVNIANGKAPFEFIENTSGEVTSTNTAMQLSSDKLLNDISAPSNVVTTSVIPSPTTTIITPTLQGNTVVNPEIVVTPLVVTTPSGEKVLVTPVVNVVSSINPQNVPVSPTGCYFNSEMSDLNDIKSAPKNISYSKFKASI